MGRTEYYEELYKIFKPKNIKWYIVTDPQSDLKVHQEEWIQHLICDIVISQKGFRHNDYPDHDHRFQDRWTKFYKTLNWTLEQLQLVDSEYYSFINDDDSVEPEYFNRIKNILFEIEQKHSFVPDIILTSMERGTGQYRFVGRHPTNKLIALPENIKPGNVGLQQMLVSGNLLKEKSNRFPIITDQSLMDNYSRMGIPTYSADCSDGMFITYMVQKYKEKVILFPDINVWFNYFELGRWQ